MYIVQSNPYLTQFFPRETEDSGYGEDGVMSDTTPLRLSEINMKPLDSYDHVISMEKGTYYISYLSYLSYHYIDYRSAV